MHGVRMAFPADSLPRAMPEQERRLPYLRIGVLPGGLSPRNYSAGLIRSSNAPRRLAGRRRERSSRACCFSLRAICDASPVRRGRLPLPGIQRRDAADQFIERSSGVSAQVGQHPETRCLAPISHADTDRLGEPQREAQLLLRHPRGRARLAQAVGESLPPQAPVRGAYKVWMVRTCVVRI